MSFPRPTDSTAPPRRLRKGVGVIVVAAWSVVAYLLYLLADGLLVWLLANGGAVVQAGKDIGTVVAPEAGGVLKALGVGDLWQGGLSLLRTILLPAVALVWLIGVAVVLLLPRIVGRFFSLLSATRR